MLYTLNSVQLVFIAEIKHIHKIHSFSILFSVQLVLLLLHIMPFTAGKDSESADLYFDISKTDKRLVRATVKTYEKTGSYVFLKLFKKQEATAEDYIFEQRLGLTIEEFQKLVKKAQKSNHLSSAMMMTATS